ncbi:tyrosine transporter [Candidatus Aerophobetes bacterium]|uniref:Tyrosine transporter n=1 Tax=Aerophobetes bacterium TaxID=2030807 RepID=A0A2A4X6P4_UNCAE|nr:MAG: tyrosine transporter [Candidatus Aerophobetes bacterium]
MKDNKVLGSSLLVAGTAIGAGMLALPVATGLSGFKYSSLLLFSVFAFMLLTLFYLLEANLFSNKIGANIITMVRDHFGPFYQGIAWVVFLLLLYTVAAAYISAGGAIVGKLFQVSLLIELAPWVGVFMFFMFFGVLVVFGTAFVDGLNRVCMVALVVSFFILCLSLFPHMELKFFQGGSFKYTFAAVPVVVLSFTSHLILPSLRTYLLGDVKKLKKVLFFGSLIPLVVYFLWEMFIFGVLPVGAGGFATIVKADQPVAALAAVLAQKVDSHWIGAMVSCFSFFALITSFFGVALSLFDFLADGLHIKKDLKGKISLLALMYIPPVIFALFYPKAFVVAIGYAGVFVAILYGIFPPLIVWKSRYIEKKEASFRVFGGKPLIIFTFVGAFTIIALQVLSTWNLLPTAS